MLDLDPKATSLIVVDLQHGVLSPEPDPFGRDAVVARGAALGRAFEAAGAPIVTTVTDFAPGYADAPRGQADAPWALPPEGLPPDFAVLVPEVAALPAAVRVVKRQMSAFFGSELDLQLRRRGVDTVVVCGVATNMGVEATARSAFDLNYHVVVAADACGSVAPGLHAFAVEAILPRIARVRDTAAVIEALQR